MILVTGATGHLGKAVVENLVKTIAPANIAVLVRDAAKATSLEEKGIDVRTGSYDDYASLVKAFKGVTKLYFVSGNDIVARLKQQENVVNAAKEAGVQHVVYTSFQRKNETGTSPIALVAAAHINTENLLKASGIRYTILKHGLYTDMLPIFMGEQVLKTGIIFQPAGDGKTAYALRTDLAEAGAKILTTEGHENKTYDFTGSNAVSYHDIADTLSVITNQKIDYISPAPEAFAAQLTRANVPAQYIGLFASFGEGIKQGEFDHVSTDLETLLGRKPVSVTQFLQQAYSFND